MANQTILKKKKRKLRLYQARSSFSKIKNIEIQEHLLQNIYRQSICKMAEVLKRGICSGIKHYNCFVNIEINADNQQQLLRNFLHKIIRLTAAQNTIFCSINIHELTNTKLMAQVFGVWVDEFDDEITGIVEDECLVEQNMNKDNWESLLIFKVKN